MTPHENETLEPALPTPIKWIEALGRDGEEATPNLRRVTWRLRTIRNLACLGSMRRSLYSKLSEPLWTVNGCYSIRLPRGWKTNSDQFDPALKLRCHHDATSGSDAREPGAGGA